MKYKQTEPYGCGLYAVAHALNIGDDFVTPERIEASKEGTNIGLLNEWLNTSGQRFFIQPIFYDSMTEGAKIPPQYFTLKYTGNENIIYFPLLFSVVTTKGSLSHMIAGQMTNSGIWIYDSLKDEPFETTIEGLNEHYYCVYGIFQFMTTKGNDIIYS